MSHLGVERRHKVPFFSVRRVVDQDMQGLGGQESLVVEGLSASHNVEVGWARSLGLDPISRAQRVNPSAGCAAYPDSCCSCDP